MRLPLLILLLAVFLKGNGQGLFDYADTLNKTRRNWVWITEGVGASTSIVLLNEVWYKNYPRSPLHSFNDNREWLQMDKVGHAMTSYYIGLAGNEMMKWSGVDQKRSVLFGSTLGLVYLTGVEILDGTSAHWGFSWGDMLANVSGTVLVGGQELLWGEQRFKMKVSAHMTTYASYRPNVLGASRLERMLKDYNGQTYWLSMNLKSMFFREVDNFPGWLNLAAGYGVEEMIAGSPDADFCITNPDLCGALSPYRQWYLSIDVDLTKVEWKRKVFKAIFGSFGWIKFPAPTIELGNGATRFYWLYF
ncbi:YfiM family protein [Parvicella tangerina]|uniref:DUF2279 domain-containing protein n=1 Tax=Parvicella tangerina TaxID=2829795 RepID=A0A916JQ19_9FLAO|nr:YfiM family protein [Parvicella tangerina]CAG5085584.1 hypothetical protein CRYO30217_02804 [Parvicella tangerina]